MDIEKLYQDVWARVFADRWLNPYEEMPDDMRSAGARAEANAAAEAAVRAWDQAKANAVIAEKAKQS